MGTRNPVAGLDTILQKCRVLTYFGTPYLFLQPLKSASSNLVHNMGSTNSMSKTTFMTKFAGVWAWGASEKFWDPYLFLQPLKLATSNLVHNLGSTSSMPKTTFRTKIGVGVG